MRVRFPRELVEECLNNCPKDFSVRARDAENDLHFGGNTLYFYNSVGNKSVNLETWEPRIPTLAEQHEAIRVLDALDNLHLVNSYTPYMEIQGVPPNMVLLESFASRIRNSTKVTISGYSHESEVFAIRMANAIGLEVPGWVMAAPPLTFYKDACDAAYRFTEAGFPVFLCSGVGYGSTGPATLAGSTVTNNIELIAGVVLIQLLKPGTKVLVADFSFPTNMKTGSPSFGNVGSSLHGAMFAQIWRSYGIPVCISASGYSNAKKMDYQCAYEKAFAGLAAALAGANVVSLHGGVFAELTYHPVQSILDDDIAGMVGRFVEGVEVSEETMAVELIEKVGPSPGHYLDKEHTIKWWKKEQFMPKAADSTGYAEWIESGKKTAINYAKERMEEIRASHTPTALADDQDKEIAKILQEANAYYTKGCNL
jgi:trimethylamine--corrinoid protein Co-methyltransferase